MKKEAIWIIWGLFVLMSMPLRGASGNEAMTAENETGSPPQAGTEGISGAVQPTQETVRDPFENQFETGPVVAPVAAEPRMAGEIKLEGAGIGPGNAFALLNGDVFYEGEEKNGIKLVRVRKQEVDLLVGGSPRTVKLVLEEEVRRLQKGKERRIKQEKTASEEISSENVPNISS